MALGTMMVLSTLAGCGSKDGGSAAVNTKPEEQGKVLNSYCWNEEFKSRFEGYYKNVPSDVKVNWVITPNENNAYQNALDAALLKQKDAAADDKIDMFLIEADYALKYVNSDYTLDVKDVGLTDDDLKDMYQYTKDIATDSKGKLKATTWQATPGLFAYRRSIAKDVLGTDDPDKVQEALSTWDKFDKVAEEERLLYVAMTRAREKLIITGVVKDADKTLDKYRGRAEQLAADGMLSFADSENIKNYLDMIMPVCLMDSDKLKGSFNVMVDAGENSETDAFESEEMSDENKKAVADKDLMSQPEVSAGYPLLDEIPEYVPDDNAAGRMKLTVSQLKAMQAEDDSEENAYMDESVKAAIKMEAYDETNSIIPKFISGKEVKLAANERGSAYHRVMECLDYSVSVNIEGVKADINRMLETGKMNELQVKSVNPWDINTFVQSDTGKRAASAVRSGKARREQPFVFEYESQLIQGIIDLYFEEDGELVIVDYKTDRVNKSAAGEQNLVKRYAVQLDYYAKALAQLTGKRVKEKIIYSFALEKGIIID